MAFWIDYPPEPKELLLVWQAPSRVTSRLRWAVGRLRIEQGTAVFRYLEGDDFRRLNLQRGPEDLKAAGFAGYPAFDRLRTPQEGFRENVLQAFMRRLPPANRSDFSQYLAYHHMRQGMSLSPLGLLAITEARLPSDGFSLIDPLDPEAVNVDIVFEVAGYRHLVGACSPIPVGTNLQLAAEPANPADPMAVQVLTSGLCIGYVNRLQAGTVRYWLGDRDFDCCVARLNGTQDEPKAFAFMRVRSRSMAAA